MTPDKVQDNNAPEVDLNPLSNPLLAANMGRWAEVYFTNPPERREQAVAVLLRELEIETAAKPALPERDEAMVTFHHAEAAPVPGVEQHPLQDVRADCVACGHHNPEGQGFCGMCGVPLTNAPVEHDFKMKLPSLLPQGPGIPEENIDEHWDPFVTADANGPLATNESATEEDDAITARTPYSGDSDLPSFARQPEPVPYRYRLYIGVVLAILLGGLIYVAKRGDVSSDGQQSPDAKVIPAPQQPAPQQPIPSAPAAQNTATNPPLPVEKVEKNENAPQPKVEAKLPPTTLARNQQAPPQLAPRPVAARTPAAAPTGVAPESQGGAADLAAAERYLSGEQATGHDTRQALPLLWDAVAKGNGPATLVLSDLYLRGDGVAQNCDQARVLLDIAAKKGAKGAGERLRHLQAFGCR
ncbi:MAG: hypothetical protein WBD59_21190 [Candidatus Sulfotelmatobacter sp.]